MPHKPTPEEWYATAQEGITLTLSRGQWYAITKGLQLLRADMAKSNHPITTIDRMSADIRAQTQCTQLNNQP